MYCWYDALFFRKHRIINTTQRIPANSANTLMFHKICVLNMGGEVIFYRKQEVLD